MLSLFVVWAWGRVAKARDHKIISKRSGGGHQMRNLGLEIRSCVSRGARARTKKKARVRVIVPTGT